MIAQILHVSINHTEDCDVLHCHIGSLQSAAAALAGRIGSRPVLCKAAIGGERSDLGEIERSGAGGRLVAWLMRQLVNIWVATTADVEHGLIRAGITPIKIIRIPNGVETRRERRRIRTTGAKRFLYLGRISTNIRRDIPTLLRAFDRLAADVPDVQLAIVGDGDLLCATRELANTLSASRQIIMPGLGQPAEWLEWADCFVLPSRREGLSNALLEAMAAGLPCIANDIWSNREVLADGEAGILVPVEDTEALERAMRAFAVNPSIARHYSERAFERVNRCYSIEAVTDQYAQLYASLTAN